MIKKINNYLKEKYVISNKELISTYLSAIPVGILIGILITYLTSN